FSFKYSDRPGVRAERLPFKVPEEEKAERLRIFQEAQNIITAAELSALLGSEAEVLVEGQSKKQEHDTIFWTGRDGGGRVVNFSASTENLIGRMVPVRIIAAKKHSLVAEIRGTPW
ncbi:MAG: TRAM domain-containing protein, partial [Desulfovibrionales bacterium]|nr:TRAM domain-containing protein [Desulfovibrionales bacterium]